MRIPKWTDGKRWRSPILWSVLLVCINNAGAASTAPPSVLWVMLDDGRADTLSCYGRPWADTSHMDRIAREGVRFETAIVQNPVCVPSRTSMKSGLSTGSRPIPGSSTTCTATPPTAVWWKN